MKKNRCLGVFAVLVTVSMAAEAASRSGAQTESPDPAAVGGTARGTGGMGSGGSPGSGGRASGGSSQVDSAD